MAAGRVEAMSILARGRARRIDVGQERVLGGQITTKLAEENQP
jgi:hypothetical protein